MTNEEAEIRLAGSRHLFAYLNCFFPISGSQLLDAGCGCGVGLLVAREYGVAEAVGVDLDLGIAGAQCFDDLAQKLEIPTTKLRLLQADVGTLRGYHEYFDAAVSMDAVEHVADLEQFLGNICDALKPGGVAVLECGALYYADTGGHLDGYFDPHELPWVHLYRDLPELLDSRGVSDWTRDEMANLNRLTFRRLRETVHKVGFRIIDERMGESSRGRLAEFRDRIDLSRVPDEEDLFRQWTRIAVQKPVPITASLCEETGEVVVEAGDRPALRGGGPFASQPGVAVSGDALAAVAVLGFDNTLWTCTCCVRERVWGIWRPIVGCFRGTPAVVVTPAGNVFVCVRDEYGGFWIVPYNAQTGYGAMSHLAGVFASDPRLVAMRDGSVHIWATDAGNLVWWGRYSEAGSFSGWRHM